MGLGVAAVVLAAGAGSRFGGGKLLADLDGRPMLQHVVDAIAAAGIARLVVVLGEHGDVLDSAVRWPAGTRRVRNPRPADGLAGSLRVGVAAARRDGEPEAILIALGDQPRLRPDVIRLLLAAQDAPPDAAPGAVPVTVPRYAGGANPNPVLLRPPAYALVDEATGDRGLGPVLRAHPELVREVPVEGDNPDVDVPADLDRLRARSRGARSRVP